MTLHQSSRLLPLAAACAIVTALGIAFVDAPVARWLATRDPTGVWDAGVMGIEYAIGIEPWKWLGVTILVAGVIGALVVPRFHAAAPAWLFVASTHLVSRNLMLWGKTLTGRLRPTEWLAHHQGATFFRDGISFPSGHVMLVASLIIPIVIVAPRWRPLAFAIPFVMCARVAVDAHFVSDVFGGLALTALVTWACAAAVRRVPWPTPPASPR
jgi:membrane-associated phospholipid phosphatase